MKIKTILIASILITLACSNVVVTPTITPPSTQAPNGTQQAKLHPPMVTAWPTWLPADVTKPSTNAPDCSVSTGRPGGALSVRVGPGKGYPAIDWLTEGDPITPTKTNEDTNWALIAPNQWVYLKFVDCKEKKP